MRYNYEFNMKYTDNPYIDIIVQCVKILGMNAVVKNENQALHYEDDRSNEAAIELIKYRDGQRNELREGPYHEEKYFEWNSYYRMLHGLPPAYTLNDEMAYLHATGYGKEIYKDCGNGTLVIPALYEHYFIDMTQYTLPEDIAATIDLSGRYLHQLPQEELSILESCGIMRQIFDEYGGDPHYQYIYHLGDKRIDYYRARTAGNFSLLWTPKLNIFDIIEKKFRRVFERNRAYTMSTVYSEAYRFMSYNYDNFIEILIIIQTMVDMISETQEYIINKDIFDSRTIRYLFESYGIAYYKEIPIKYQIRIIKNVNTLLKYKSSHRNITDIMELFDDTTTIIYTYYLMKTKAVNRENFSYYTEEDINPKYNEDDRPLPVEDRTWHYWIGPNTDISNNKVPLMSTNYNVEEPSFIKSHIYNYRVRKGSRAYVFPDIFENRILTKELEPDVLLPQPLVNQIVTLETLDGNFDSFLTDFLRNVNWFNVTKYTTGQEPEKISNRNEYLDRFAKCLTKRISIYFNNLKLNHDELAMNTYNYRKIKYYLYTALGIFNQFVLNRSDFDTMSDTDLEKYFYTKDTLITDIPNFIDEYGIDVDRLDYDDRYILHHTIPFMVRFDYKTDSESKYTDNFVDKTKPDDIIEYKQEMYDCSIFKGSTFSDTHNIADIYKITKRYRENYILAIRAFVEGLFEDLAVDPLYNPTPRYIGYMDLGIVRSQLNKRISEFEIGDEVTVPPMSNIPVYNSYYVYQTVTKDMIGMENFAKNYDMCFLKVPILDPNAYKMLERFDMRRNYDVITLADPFWDGVTIFDILTDEERARLHESKRREILNKDFTIERTKYIGVEAAIDLTKMSYQLCYFMNMLFDRHKDEEAIYIDIDEEVAPSGRVRLNDILVFAMALNYLYQGIEPDNMTSDMENNMYINGFNFDNNWTDIYNYLQNQHHIYNNYEGEPDKTYDYIDEFGEEHHVVDGYGMDPLEKGWMTELYDDWIEYEWPAAYDYEPEVRNLRIFLGQPASEYIEDPETGEKIPVPIIDPETGDPINMRHPKDRDDGIVSNPKIGAFLSGRYDKCADDCITSAKMELDFGWSDIWYYNLNHAVKYDMADGTYSTMDISWRPTQYPVDDNNSHGLWLDTDILRQLEDDSHTDLERINMLKKIYTSNTNLYNHLTYMMRTAQSKRMHDIYKVVYDSYMETKMNHDFYKLIDNAGNPVYTDIVHEGSSYHIVEIDFFVKDDDGYPKFDLVNIITGEKERYHYYHNTDFTGCYYICDTDFAKHFNCIINKNSVVYNPDNKPNYLISNDYPNEFPNGYMYPEDSTNPDYTFIIARNRYTLLQNTKDKRILIPITVDSGYKENGRFDYILTMIKDPNIIKPAKEYKYPDDYIPNPEFPDGYIKEAMIRTAEIWDPNLNTTVIRVENLEKDEDTLVVSDWTTVKMNWKIASSYYEYMQYRNIELYNQLIDLKYNYSNVWDPVSETYKPSDEKRVRIETLCEYIVIALEKYFDKDEWRYLFNIIPTANIKNIQSWILKMVIFFKSWKTQIVDVGMTYIVDDPYNNHVHILDDLYYSSKYTFIDKIQPKEHKYFEMSTEYRDKVNIRDDRVEFKDIVIEPYTIEYGFGEKIYGHRFDFPDFNNHVAYKDLITPSEKLEMNVVEYLGDVQTSTSGGYTNYLFP